MKLQTFVLKMLRLQKERPGGIENFELVDHQMFLRPDCNNFEASAARDVY